MERAAYRMELKKKRIKEIEKNKQRLAIFILLTIFIMVGVCTTLNAIAKNNTDNTVNKKPITVQSSDKPEIRYTSHQVTAGSSLWDISISICDELGLSVFDTIEIIKGINSLTCDDIFEGQCIIIPYLKSYELWI